jgi:hypothetical protein
MRTVRQARLVLPWSTGALSAQLTEEVFLETDAQLWIYAPSTMLRMVPLPRGTGEDKVVP